MYEQFYGLTCRPFQLNPDPAFFYASKQHGRAKSYLEYGLSQGEGFVVITGDIGTGKTTILRGMLDALDTEHLVVGHLVTTQLEAEDTLRMVAAAFGVHAIDSAKSKTLSALEAHLTHQAAQGRRCLLVVDEAQNLDMRAIEELRMLSNFQIGNQALLQTFLVGQPELRATMQRPALEQLRQRVVATCHLGPMDLEDTQHYIAHRLQRAGDRDVLRFTPLAMVALHAATKGVPRRINTLCDRLLLYGYLKSVVSFDEADVEYVAKEMADEAGLTVAHEDDPAKHDEAVHFKSVDQGLERVLIRLEATMRRIEELQAQSLRTQHAILEVWTKKSEASK